MPKRQSTTTKVTRRIARLISEFCQFTRQGVMGRVSGSEIGLEELDSKSIPAGLCVYKRTLEQLEHLLCLFSPKESTMGTVIKSVKITHTNDIDLQPGRFYRTHGYDVSCRKVIDTVCLVRWLPETKEYTTHDGKQIVQDCVIQGKDGLKMKYPSAWLF